jgi:stage V sporulation protein AF
LKEVKIAKDIDVNLNYLKDLLGVGETFDIVFREYKVSRKRAASFSINGMTNDLILTNVFDDMTVFKQEELSINTMQKLFYSRATHCQVKLVDNMPDAVTSILSGELIFILDGETQFIVIDARSYPVRATSESNIEKVTRGSKDSFVETLPFNSTLIRRRLRDPNLRFEIVKVGTRSRCDVVVCYIKDITNLDLVADIKKRLNSIDRDGVPMAEKTIEEYIVGGFKFNPFPKVRYTERPDVASVHLLEGHVCLIVDTSPSIMILPTTMWHHVQHAEEFHQNILIGSYLRLVRLFGMLLSLFLPPLWLALALSWHILPDWLSFLGSKEAGIVPLGLQFLLAEIGIELVRMATIHVPSAQSTALGFIGAFMLGEFATKVGLFGNETIFYAAVAAVGAFATPSVEFAMAVRLLRTMLLILVIFFQLHGFFIGTALIFLLLLFTRSFGIPYLWPLLPFNWAGMKDALFRLPMPSKVMRPTALKPQDLDMLKPGGKREPENDDADK